MWVIMVSLLISFHGIVGSESGKSIVYESYASEFFVGFISVPRQPYKKTEISLHITTNDPDPVTFTVSAPHSDVNITAVATNRGYTTVVLPNSLEVESGDLTDRNKGIHVRSHRKKKISIYGLSNIVITANYSAGDYFLVMPCTDLGLHEYIYYGINITGQNSFLVSSILIATCEDNTTVTTPSTTLVLNSLQTYWFEIRATSKITTSKPVSFFVIATTGADHCFNDLNHCDQFIEQQLPSAIWGDTFMVAVYSDSIVTVIAAHDSTYLSVSCTLPSYSEPTLYYLEEGENFVNTSQTKYIYCFFQSSSPILIGRGFAYSDTNFMSLELPITHYSNNYLLLDFDDNYCIYCIIHLFVEPEYYQPEGIVIEAYNFSESNEPVLRLSNFTWTELYCNNSEICGYGVLQQIERDLTRHKVYVYHENSEAKLGLQASGSNNYYLDLQFIYTGGINYTLGGCPAITNEPISSSYPNITYNWPETEIGSFALYNCTCHNILELDQKNMDTVIGRRQCGGTYTAGAMWEPVNIIEECGLSNSVLQLCQTLLTSRNNPEMISETLAGTTSNSTQIKAVDISAVTTLLESLSSVAATLEDENVTRNFLVTIDNLILANSSEIAQSQAESRTSSRLLNILTDFTDNVQVPNTSNAITFVQRSYALHIANINTTSFAGETLTVSSDQELNNKYRTISTTPGINQTINTTVTAAVKIPETIFQDLGLNENETQRLSYTLITEDSLFMSSNENLTLVSSVVSVRVNNSENSVGEFQNPIELFLKAINKGFNITCGLWNQNAADGFGSWAMHNCEIVQNRNATPEDDKKCPANDQTTLITAQYTQPGHFGLLLDVTYGIVEPTPYTFVLEVISYIGLPMSLICLATFIITYITTAQLRESDHGQLLINMSIALMCLYVTFLIGAHAAPVPPICGIAAALLQYFMLVFFGWTTVEAIYLYRKLVKVLRVHIPKFVLKAALVVWSAPLIVVIPLNSYYYISTRPTCNATTVTTMNAETESSTPLNNHQSGFCRAVGPPFWAGTVAPFVVTYLINWIIFILIMVSMYQPSQRKLQKDDNVKFVKKQILIGFGLATLFGLGWGLGLAAINTTVHGLSLAFQILFSIFIAFQGVLFFVLHGIKKEEARNQWKNWFTKITGKRSQ